MPPPKTKPPKPSKRVHQLSVKWGKFKATGEGFGVLGVILLYATPALIALLVKVLVS